nr:hypothetical protein [Pseudanabaena sp. SR411]
MPKAIQELYAQVISNLLTTERLQLAILTLNGLVKQDVAVIDDSDTWTEKDQLDLATFSLQYAALVSQWSSKFMQVELLEQISSKDAEVILKLLPERIRVAIIARSKEIDYPIEATLEMAIASFLDIEAISFADCNPNRGY